MSGIKGVLSQTEPGNEIGTAVPIITDGIGTRINALSKLAEGKGKLAEMAGLSESQLHRIVKGTSSMKLENAALMAKALQINIEWLTTGEGPMRSGEPDPDIGAQFAMIAHYDVEASAGPGSIIEREPEIGKLAFRKAWIEQKGLVAKDLMGIRVKGDSMSPTIRDGAIVLVDSRRDDFSDDGIYVLQYDGHLVAKRLQRDALSGGVLIKSDNKSYETQTLNREQLSNLYIIGRVVWVGQEV